MSTDGPKPPSIAPKKPASGGASAVTTPEAARPRPASGPVSGPGAPSTRPAPSTTAGTLNGPASNGPTSQGGPSGGQPGRPTGDDSGPSMTDRLKKAAASVAESTKNALPTREHHDESAAPPRAPRAPRPAAAAASSATTTTTSAGPRRVRLAVARVDPWSVMKLAFLLSVAIGIMIVVSAAVIWYTLDGLAVFTQVNDTIAEVTGSPDFFNLLEYAAFDRVLSLATMIAVVDVVLLTALSTIGAFLYNITAALVGGLHLTLTDD